MYGRQGWGRLSSESQDVVTRTIVRKRRSLRHRQNRRVRRALLIFFCAVFTFVFSSVALRYLSPSLFHRASLNVEPSRQSAEASRELLVQKQTEILRDIESRKIYPYSVVPGGVRTVRELKLAAEHDPVVRAHYAGFDYEHARVVKLLLARSAYVSYRIGNKVYWTRRRVRLKKGETVITDGKITARTRCANRVEEVPQQATSKAEPPAGQFEDPVQPEFGTAMQAPPVPFQSALLNRNPVPGLGPAPPLSSLSPIDNGGWLRIYPPPLPGVCGIGTKKKHDTGGIGEVSETGKGKKKKLDPCGNGGGGAEVPEPGTWLLMGTGLALLCWKMRRKLARANSLQS